MKTKLIALLVGLILPLASSFAGEATPAAAGGPIVIGMSLVTLQHPFFAGLKGGAEQEAAKLGAKMVFADSGGSPSKQSGDLMGFVAMGVQGILLTPIAADSPVPAIEAAVEAGIPVAVVGERTNTEKVLVQVGVDDLQGGRAAARFIIDRLGNKGSVMMLEGMPDSSSATDRRAGFEEVIKKSNVRVLVSQTAYWRRDVGYRVMASLVQKYPDFDAVWSANDDMIIGAIGAMTAANIDPRTKVTVGFDALPDALQYVEDGRLSATIDGLPRMQAAEALQYLVDYIKNKTMPPKKVMLIAPKLVTKAPPGGT